MIYRLLTEKKGRNMIGIVAGCLLLGLLLMLPWQVNANAPVNLVVNNQILSPEVPPLIVNGRVMVPLRCIAEALSTDVRWDEASRTVYVSASAPASDKGPIKNVPVRPNASIINGKVLGYSVQNASLVGMQGTDPRYLLDIQIESSEDIPGEFNFIKNSTGSIIKAYSTISLPADAYGCSISARITYHGDEHGGKYWLSDTHFQ